MNTAIVKNQLFLRCLSPPESVGAEAVDCKVDYLRQSLRGFLLYQLRIHQRILSQSHSKTTNSHPNPSHKLCRRTLPALTTRNLSAPGHHTIFLGTPFEEKKVLMSDMSDMSEVKMMLQLGHFTVLKYKNQS